MEKNSTVSEIMVTVLLFILFNLFLLNIEWVKILLGLPWKVVEEYRMAQYFFTYSDEFVRRGFVGTIWNSSGIKPTLSNALFLAVFLSNIFFLLFVILCKKTLTGTARSRVVILLLFLIISPAVTMHLGFDSGRFDHANLVIMLVSVLLLMKEERSYHYVVIPILLSIGLLIHEAFLFVNFPLILAVSYNEILKKKHSKGLLYLELASVVVTLFFIFLWGGAGEDTIAKVRSRAIAAFPDYDPSYSLLVWSSSLGDTMRVTISRYATVLRWIYLISVLPLFYFYYSFYSGMLNYKRLKTPQKYIFLAPYSLFPLFFLGIDFFRWVSLIITLMFVSFVYLMRDLEISIPAIESGKEKVFAALIVLYTFAGPIGLNCSFPYMRTLVQSIF